MKAGKVIREKGSRNYELYGQEAIGGTWSLSKMNMFLNNEDNHRIEWGDTIRNPLLKDSEGKLFLLTSLLRIHRFHLRTGARLRRNRSLWKI